MLSHFPQGLFLNAPCSALKASFESAGEEIAEIWLRIISFRAGSLVATNEMVKEAHLLKAVSEERNLIDRIPWAWADLKAPRKGCHCGWQLPVLEYRLRWRRWKLLWVFLCYHRGQTAIQNPMFPSETDLAGCKDLLAVRRNSNASISQKYAMQLSQGLSCEFLGVEKYRSKSKRV